MSDESRIEALLDVIEESYCIDPDILSENLAKEEGLLLWSGVPENRLPRPDILRDIHREQAMEVLYGTDLISAENLREFRLRLMSQRLECLDDGPYDPIRSEPSDAPSLRDEARLHIQFIESYRDRAGKYQPRYDTIREDLKYVELLAGKVLHSLPGLCRPNSRYACEVLETLAQSYDKGADDVTQDTYLHDLDELAHPRQPFQQGGPLQGSRGEDEEGCQRSFKKHNRRRLRHCCSQHRRQAQADT